jgi:hypothetical protein
VSDVGPRGEHVPLGVTARHAFARVAHYVPAYCPLIIESIISAELIEHELDAVAAVFEGETLLAATA